MRLDKFISKAAGITRKDATRAIRKGLVRVEGRSKITGSTHLDESDRVFLDNQALSLPQKHYFMLHKPKGYVCANTDSQHPTVIDLIKNQQTQDLQIAGRLDLDTTGLVLLTNDGAWNHVVTAPKMQCTKTYRVSLEEAIHTDAILTLEQGIHLRNEKKPLKPAVVKMISDTCIELTISEGKYHQVKRMCAAIGNKVLDLHRLRIGGITLDSNLNEGDYRPLTLNEINSIQGR